MTEGRDWEMLTQPTASTQLWTAVTKVSPLFSVELGFHVTCEAESADPDSQLVSKFLAILTRMFISRSEAPGRLSRGNLSWWKINDRWQQRRGWNSSIQAPLGSQAPLGHWLWAVSMNIREFSLRPRPPWIKGLPESKTYKMKWASIPSRHPESLKHTVLLFPCWHY